MVTGILPIYLSFTFTKMMISDQKNRCQCDNLAQNFMMLKIMKLNLNSILNIINKLLNYCYDKY